MWEISSLIIVSARIILENSAEFLRRLLGQSVSRHDWLDTKELTKEPATIYSVMNYEGCDYTEAQPLTRPDDTLFYTQFM